MIKALKNIKAMIQFFIWLMKLRRQIEKEGKSFLSHERAKSIRLFIEKMFYDLSREKTENLPKITKWLFARTELDNQIGMFGMWLLKSEKLKNNDPKLAE